MTSAPQHTDQELLEAMRSDDEKAFNELFNRYWRKVHSMAYARVRSREVTEEIVQELFTSLWDKRNKHTIQHLPSYFYQAVKFKGLNYMESKIVEEKYWDYYRKFVPQKEDVTEKIVVYHDLLDAIEKGMTCMPEKAKKVFTLHRMEGWSITEIANTMNLSEKAIQYHLTRSLKQLRVHLKNYILGAALLIHFLPF